MGALGWHSLLDGSDRLAHAAPEPFQHSDSPLEPVIGLGDKYAGGAFSIIINFDAQPRTGAREIGPILHGTENLTPTYRMENDALVIHDPVRGALRSAQDWRDNGMFIRIVKMVEIVECRTTTTDEGFRDFDGVFHPLTGCFYSLAGGFEVNPALCCREFSVAVLRAAVPPDQLPEHMVEGAPHIVDTIAYYKGERAWNWLVKAKPEDGIPGVGVGLSDKSVRFFGHEGGELPFEVRNVIIGPLDFLFGAIEHG
jgi:hypothetical protein